MTRGLLQSKQEISAPGMGNEQAAVILEQPVMVGAARISVYRG
jgi:hypothetical protein